MSKTFEIFNGQSWGNHFKDPEGVAASFPEGLALVDKPEHLTMLAKLIAHVEGEHLGRWGKGREALALLKKNKHFTEGSETHAAIERYDRSLRYCAGDGTALNALDTADMARVLANSCASLAGRGDPARAKAAYEEAMGYAGKLDKADPAQKDLAITFNNMALGLESTEKLGAGEVELMLLAAKAARLFWENAGPRTKLPWAEYRLCLAFVKAGMGAEAVKHSEIILELGAAQSAEPLDFFFFHQANALAERCNGNNTGFQKARERARDMFSKIKGEDNISWCKETLDQLNALS